MKEFKTTEELIRQAKKDRACKEGVKWAQDKPLQTILEEIDIGWRVWCIGQGYIQFIRTDADVNARDIDGTTPLHLAIVNGRTEIAEFLIKHNADVNARDIDGTTPLHLAIGNGRTEIAEFLIKHNADVNARDSNGETPLYLAIGNGRTEIAELLKKYGGEKWIKRQ